MRWAARAGGAEEVFVHYGVVHWISMPLPHFIDVDTGVRPPPRKNRNQLRRFRCASLCATRRGSAKNLIPWDLRVGAHEREEAVGIAVAIPSGHLGKFDDNGAAVGRTCGKGLRCKGRHGCDERRCLEAG